MLKLLFGLMIAFVFQAVSFSQHDIPRLPLEIIRANLHSRLLVSGNITYKRDWEHLIMEGKITSQDYGVLITEYDKWGRKKEVLHIDRSGKTSSIDVYEYLPNSLLKKITSYHPTGQTLGIVELTYNTMNFLIEETEYDQYDYIINRVLYQINLKDTTITENYFDTQQTLSRSVKKGYSNFFNGELKWLEEFDANSNLLYRKEIEYRNSKIYREMFFDSNRLYDHYLEYYYDPHGMLSKIIKNFPGGTHYTHYTCKFNELGLLIGEIKYGNHEKIVSYFKYTYR